MVSVSPAKRGRERVRNEREDLRLEEGGIRTVGDFVQKMTCFSSNIQAEEENLAEGREREKKTERKREGKRERERERERK